MLGQKLKELFKNLADKLKSLGAKIWAGLKNIGPILKGVGVILWFKLKKLKNLRIKSRNFGYFPAIAGMVIACALSLAFVLAVRLESERHAACMQECEDVCKLQEDCKPQIVEVIKEVEVIREVRVGGGEVNPAHAQIAKALRDEFGRDATRWQAVIDDNRLSISFNSPDMIFDFDKAVVKDALRNTLRDFFPRYVALVRKHAADIDSIHVQGHTDTRGSYLHNMGLSQRRSRNVHKVCFDLARAQDQEWLKQNFFTAGASFARPTNSYATSRRVEFHIKLKQVNR
ncbi:MAG: OmpA family protein [Alphaproteobacteria bacterium]|nr:OmpA family protein [Alphaproteobacteria bacterium]